MLLSPLTAVLGFEMVPAQTWCFTCSWLSQQVHHFPELVSTALEKQRADPRHNTDRALSGLAHPSPASHVPGVVSAEISWVLRGCGLGDDQSCGADAILQGGKYRPGRSLSEPTSEAPCPTCSCTEEISLLVSGSGCSTEVVALPWPDPV